MTELFEILPCVRGRYNFVNIGRYSSYNESTLRRNYAKYFDWMKWNILLLFYFLNLDEEAVIGVMDCSFIKKAGKHTANIDRFWSGVAKRALKGLEISLVSIVEISSGRAWSLNVRQTPSGLSAKESDESTYTRIDFYVEQLIDCIVQLPLIQYYVGDGMYAKLKVISALCAHSKHLISKLRPDANLRYLLSADEKQTAHGNTKYGKKVNWKALNLDLWEFIGSDYKYPHLHLYTQVLYSPQFKCNIRVVFVWNIRTGKYVLLFSTDTSQNARQIVLFYQLRFKIEFIFRDAKQFTGLTHCQARDEAKLDYHFNVSLAALNIYQAQAVQEQVTISLNSLIRKAHNTKLVQLLFDKLNSNDEFDVFFDINRTDVQNVINLGQMRA